MSHITTASVVVVLGAGTSIGAAYVTGAFERTSELPQKLEDFQNGYGGKCVKSIFPGVYSLQADEKEVQEIKADSNKVESSEFSSSGGTSQNISSCLVVNWDKWKNTESKGRGNFRFLWALSKGDKGFVAFATGNTSTEISDKKVKFKGAAYLLNKTDNRGKITKKLLVNSEKGVEAGKFPKPDNSLMGLTDTSNKGWKFMEESQKLDKLCDDSCDTSKSPDEYFRGHWVWKGTDVSGSVDKGTSNLTEGWNEIYEKTKWDIDNVFSTSGSNGKWEKVYLHTEGIS